MQVQPIFINSNLFVRTLKPAVWQKAFMESVIIKAKNGALKRYVQYFLFFRKTDNNYLNYTTFPNKNICLAIYKDNNVNYINQLNENKCIIKKGNDTFKSKFYGLHKVPFKVEINSPLDQICIIFHPSALRAFSSEPYDHLMNSEDVLKEFLSLRNSYGIEEIFDEYDLSKRALKLEDLLLKKIKYGIHHKINEALDLISLSNGEMLNVNILAKDLGISTSSLFRLFKNNLGQSPKFFLKTIRFRCVLNQILNEQTSLTKIAHDNQYHDQAHFINDFKLFSGYSPLQLIDKISVQQTDLTWIYNKK